MAAAIGESTMYTGYYKNHASRVEGVQLTWSFRRSGWLITSCVTKKIDNQDSLALKLNIYDVIKKIHYVFLIILLAFMIISLATEN